jgi:3-(3-hydroxy-phenyl)propionate hydroxylase
VSGQVIYEFDSQLTTNWRVGRTLIAGDAAHQMGPILGQGACSGMRDGINLAWKLDLFLRGISDESLIDTYQQERLPHVRELIVRSAEIGRLSTERDPERAKARDKAILEAGANETMPMPKIGAGVLQRDEDGAPPPVGELGPQGRVLYNGRSGRADDLIGWGWALLTKGMAPLAEVSSEQSDFLGSIGGRTISLGDDPASTLPRDLDGVYMDFFEAHEAVAVLVRPDFYVFGVARDRSEVPALLEDLRAQLATLGADHPAGGRGSPPSAAQTSSNTARPTVAIL